MGSVVRPFLVRGRAVPLARYLAEEEIEGLVACSCIGNEVTIDLADTRILVSLADVGAVVGLTFHMVQDGPAKPRSWTRRLPGDAGSKELATCIARDVRTLERELAPLRRRPPEDPERRRPAT